MVFKSVPLCHRGVATSRNATCSSPEQRHPTTHATTAAAAAPAPRPSATAPLSLLSLARHYSDALPRLPSAPRGRRTRSTAQRAARGGRRPVTRHATVQQQGAVGRERAGDGGRGSGARARAGGGEGPGAPPRLSCRQDVAAEVRPRRRRRLLACWIFR